MTRNIIAVIDELVACAPDLEPGLKPIKKQAEVASPDVLQARFWWLQVATVLHLNQYHEKKEDLRKIFAGKKEDVEVPFQPGLR